MSCRGKLKSGRGKFKLWYEFSGTLNPHVVLVWVALCLYNRVVYCLHITHQTMKFGGGIYFLMFLAVITDNGLVLFHISSLSHLFSYNLSWHSTSMHVNGKHVGCSADMIIQSRQLPCGN